MASLEVDDLILEIDRILSPCTFPDRPVPAFLFGAEVGKQPLRFWTWAGPSVG